MQNGIGMIISEEDTKHVTNSKYQLFKEGVNENNISKFI